MYARIRSGGCNAGKILSLHRYYNTADRKCAASFELVVFLNNRSAKIGDNVPDWIALYTASKKAMRRGDFDLNPRPW